MTERVTDTGKDARVESARGRALAVIPARAGSKRLPGKNVRLLCGQPAIAYSIEAARESQPVCTDYRQHRQ